MRIRTIKPEFWAHPVLGRLADSVRLAAVGVLSLADDEGYFVADALAVRSSLWPFDEDSTRARAALDELSRIGFVEVVNHPERGRIGRVVNFRKHQRIDRPTPSRIACYFLDESSVSPRRVLDESSTLDQGSGNKGTREQGTRESSRSTTPHPQPEASDRPVEELPLEESSAGTPQDESDPPARCGDPTPTPKTPHAQRREAARGILDHLNTRASRSFRPSDQYLKAIDARLAEVKGDVSGVLAMIDRQVALWAHDPQMAECLNPVTLFRPSKFPRYYDDRNRPLPAPGVRNGCAGAKPHRNDFIGTPESRAAWAAQCAAADERLVEGF